MGKLRYVGKWERYSTVSITIPLTLVALKAKQCLYKPLGPQEVDAPRISRQSEYEGDKDVRPTLRPPLVPESTSGTLFVRGWVDPRAIVRPESLQLWVWSYNDSNTSIITITWNKSVYVSLKKWSVTKITGNVSTHVLPFLKINVLKYLYNGLIYQVYFNNP